MRSIILALAAASLLSASPVLAGGGVAGDFEIGGYGGYGWLDHHGDFRPKDGFLYGGRIGYFVSPHWSFEASGQSLPTKHREDLDIVTPGLTSDTQMHLNGYRFNGLYNFAASENFRPFVTAGVGRETFNVEDFGDTKEFGWNAGVGFRWFMGPTFNIRGDGRYVSAKMDQFPEPQKNVEATLGLGLTFGGGFAHHAGMGAYNEEASTQVVANRPPTVTCDAERSEIGAGESVTVHATASDPDGDPLTYQWSTSVGHLVGATQDATFDFTGVTAPTNATITVTVTDGHGHSATSNCSVAMAAPKAQAEPLSCMGTGFRLNSSRLSNVDKACLDDLSQRLSADPRATVTVVGYGESQERSTMGDLRAKAVRDYLTREKNIESSRVTVRSEAAGTSLETGNGNRRVVIWFVPEGATIPE